MSYVQTVLGKVESSNIGITDSHEHLIRIGGGEVIHGGHDFLMDSYENAKSEIGLYKNFGGSTIVEMTPCGSGRDITSLVNLSRDTGINIISTTGFHKSELYDTSHFIYRYTKEQIAELLIADVEEGIDIYDYCGPIVKRGAAKAGVIKGALSYQVIYDIEKKVLKAAAIASKKTGAPISLHSEKGTMALEAAELLINEKVDPNNIIICHIDRNPDLYYHKQLLNKGIYLEYDGPSRVKYYTDECIVNLISNVCKEGFSDQILMGGDLGRRSYFKSYSGGPGLDYILKYFVPRLKNEIGEELVDKILTKNPGKAFAIKK